LVAFILYASSKTLDIAWTWHLGNQLMQFAVLVWATLILFAAWTRSAGSQRAINILAILILVF